MMQDVSSNDMRKIAASFAELLRLLTHDGEVERPADIRDLLIDRLRDALDRRLPSLPDAKSIFVANTFLVEAAIHANERTVISRIRHRDLGTWHAMKTISIDRSNEALAKAMLLREARIGMALRHPNLVAVQCAIRLPDGRLATISEWVGPSLAQRLSAGGISLTEVKQAMKSLLLGLAAIHEAGYVHGDLSPANLLLHGDNLMRLKIADFGSAIESGRRYSDLDIAKAATPAFAAPELSPTGAVDLRADLYSAGRVMKLLLDHCGEESETTARLNGVVEQLTDHDPSKRPPNAMAALELITER